MIRKQVVFVYAAETTRGKDVEDFKIMINIMEGQ